MRRSSACHHRGSSKEKVVVDGNDRVEQRSDVKGLRVRCLRCWSELLQQLLDRLSTAGPARFTNSSVSSLTTLPTRTSRSGLISTPEFDPRTVLKGLRQRVGVFFAQSSVLLAQPAKPLL